MSDQHTATYVMSGMYEVYYRNTFSMGFVRIVLDQGGGDCEYAAAGPDNLWI